MEDEMQIRAQERLKSNLLARGERFRHWIRDNYAIIGFLGAYALLTVSANVIYLFADWGQSSVIGFSLSQFPSAWTAGFWILLFMPFVVAPPVALATRRVLGKLVSRVSWILVEFRPVDYIVIVAGCYAYVIYAFWQADVSEIAFAGTGAFASVQARFNVQEALGYWPQMALKSILTFLAVYAFVAAIQTRRAIWISAFLINFFLLSFFLLLLNMKWPVLIFYVAIAGSAFLYSRKRPYLNALAGVAGLILAYIFVSIITLRLVPLAVQPAAIVKPHEPPKIPMQDAQSMISQSLRTEFASRQIVTGSFEQPRPKALAEKPVNSAGLIGRLQGFVENSVHYAPLLIANGLNRMGISYPYYYQIFSEKGQICGTLGDRLQRKRNPCQPSNLVYETIWGEGGFGGRATAPAAAHISGYALGGWSGALIELIIVSIVLGTFMSLPGAAEMNVVIATVAAMGGITGYFFSQLPVEGPIIYDHGILWWTMLILGYSLFRALPRQWTSKFKAFNVDSTASRA